MRKLKIFIIALAFVLLGLTVLVDWQYGNIKAVFYSYMYSNDDIDSLIQKHYDEIHEYLENNDKYNVRQSTELEEKLHKSELITDDEFIDLLTGKKDMNQIFGMDINLNESEKFVAPDGSELTKEDIVAAKQEVSSQNQASNTDNPQNSSQGGSQNNIPDKPKDNTQAKPQNNTQNNQSGNSDNTSQGDSQNNSQTPSGNTSAPSSDEKVSASIARMYVLKSTFESQLDAIYVEAVAYYSTLTPEQKKNSKSELMKSFYNRATALERSCDAQVSAVLSDLESTLNASGESTELVGRIQTAYNEEKSLKKAYYINMYKS